VKVRVSFTIEIDADEVRRDQAGEFGLHLQSEHAIREYVRGEVEEAITYLCDTQQGWKSAKEIRE
jgi:hypothetical protein